MTNVVSLDLRENSRSFLSANLSDAAERHSAAGNCDTARCLRDLAAQVDGTATDARPLVVIDPEDREQVERLARCLPVSWALFQPDDPQEDEHSIAAVQAALREFASPKPPKPEEPTGLGAVVEDGLGTRWTRVESGEAETRNPWYPSACDIQPAEWDDINAVRILSPGYTEDGA